MIKRIRGWLEHFCYAQAAGWRDTEQASRAAAFVARLRGDVVRAQDFDTSAKESRVAVERWERRAARFAP